MKIRILTKLIKAFTAILLFMSIEANAQFTILNNGYLRMGNGNENSVNNLGNVQQPFYYNSVMNVWYKLTYSIYPLDYALGHGGIKTNEWNINGSIVTNPTLTNQVIDAANYIATSSTTGYGVLKSTGTVNIGGKFFRVEQTYTLPQASGYIGIKVRVTNIDATLSENVRIWVGTRDDWVGNSDVPLKQKGNLVNGNFVQIANAGVQSTALKISTGSEAVLVYTNSTRGYCIAQRCCSFQNVINQNPLSATAPNGSFNLPSITNDGSYGFYVRMNDLAPNQSDEFTWYYAAGTLADIEDIITEVAQASGSVQNITCTGATLNATVTANGTGYWMVVPQGSTAPTASQIKAGVNYGNVSVITRGSGAMLANNQTAFNITGLTSSSAYTVYFVHEDAVPQFTSIVASSFNTITLPTASITSNGPLTFCDGNSVTLSATAGTGISYLWSNNATTQNITVTQAGTYRVTISNACGDNSTSNTLAVVVNPLPVATITASGPTTFCPSGNVTLSTPTGSGYTYQWLNNNVNIFGANSNSYTTSTSGNYSVVVTSNGCQSTASQLVSVVADIIAPTVITQNATIYLDAAGNASLSPAQIDNGSNDACGIQTLSVTPNSFTCADLITTQPNNYALRFDGVDDYLQSATTNAIKVLPLTLEAWVKPELRTEATNFYPNNVISNDVPGQHGHGFGANVNNLVNQITVEYENGFRIINNAGLNTNAWQHIAVVYTSGNVKTYVNGVLKDNFNFTQSALNAGSYLWLGKHNNDTGYGTRRFYKGDLDEARVWHRALTQTEIQTNMSTTTVASAANLLLYYTFENGPGSTIVSDIKMGANATLVSMNANTAWINPGAPVTIANLSNTVTLTAVDAAGNSSTGTAGLTVLDTINPVISCPANISVNATSSSGALVNYTAPVGTDNCTASTVRTAGLASGSTFPIGTTTVTHLVTDASGNTATCSFSVTVLGLAPQIVCPANIAVNNTTGICGAAVTYAATESIGIPASTINYSIAPGSLFSVGTTTVTATATNPVGTSSCTFTVTVNDAQAPNTVAQNVTVYLNSSGNANISATDIDNGSTDNCTITSMSVSPSTFNCANVGPNTVTLTVTDVNNNTSTATAVVTVVDNVAPVAIAQNVTVQLDATGNGSTTATAVNNGSNDACGIASLALSQTAFTCSHVGPNTVTLTVTDNHGNTSTTTAVVTVEDNVAPMAIAQNVTIHLDATGNGSTTATAVNNGSNDACGIASLGLSQTAFTCTHVGANTVTLTVTDNNGNVSTAPAVVTVVDNIAPVAIAQNVSVAISNGMASVSPTQIDNGSNDACGIASLSVYPNTFGCGDIGNHTVTLTVTDVNGNVSTTTATVTVTGVVPSCSIASLPNSNVYTGGNSNKLYLGYGATATTLSSTVSGGSGFTYSWSGQGLSCYNCANPVFTPTTSGNFSFTLTVTNSIGCVSTCSMSICVLDIRQPVQGNGNGNAGKVYVCKVPPGNPSNTHTISVSVNAVAAHLATGSYLGQCGASCGILARKSEADSEGLSDVTGIGYSLQVFPNPTSGAFNVYFTSDAGDVYQINVYDATGRFVYNDSGFSYKQKEMNLDLTPGLYMIEVIQGDYRNTVRLVKN